MGLCQKWPKDETKAGRDYGDFIRNQLIEHFPQGDLGQVKNTKQVESMISSLERLANNQYYNENPLKRSSASGLESYCCRDAVSNEGIMMIHEENENTLYNRLKGVLSMKFAQDERDKPQEKKLQIEGESSDANKDHYKDSK